MFGRLILAVFVIICSLYAQPDRPFPTPPDPFSALKQNLGLSTAQIEQLVLIMNEKYAALREAARKISEKQGELQTLLHSGSKDAVRIGQLMIEIHELSTQPPPANAPYRERALAVLTAEQRTKLAPLDQALKLYTPASQAAVLNLIDQPVVVMPAPGMILPPIGGRGGQ